MNSDPPASPKAAATDFSSAVVRELSRYISDVNAAAILSVCATSLGIKREQLGTRHLGVIVKQVRSSFEFFGVSQERLDRCLGHLRMLDSSPQIGVPDDVTIAIIEERDLVAARTAGKGICRNLGFTEIGATKVMTAISELSRNIFKYAGRGEVRIRRASGERPVIEVIAIDRGPGIPDINRVLSPVFQSKTGMGRGLRGTRSLMDFFEIQSRAGEGTTVTVRKEKC